MSLLSRRKFLAASSATLAALAVGGVVGAGALELPVAAPGRFCLSGHEVLLVQALAEALFPPGNALGVTAVGMDLAGEVDELMGDRLDPVVTPVFRRVLQVLDDGTLVSRGARFADLPLGARVDVMAAWAEPGVLARRLMYDALRTVVGMVFFCRPEVCSVIGWRPACAVDPELGAIPASMRAVATLTAPAAREGGP